MIPDLENADPVRPAALPPDESATSRSRAPTGRASDLVIADLEEKIVSGALPEGTPLPAERDLVGQYQTSRTVIREAITALSNRGLLENRPRFRPVVRRPGYTAAMTAVDGIMRHLLGDDRGVKNLYESRIFLERALAREAATSARKDDIQDLRIALARNEAVIDGDPQAFYSTDVDFHGVLYRIARNPIFPAIHGAYTSWLGPHWQRMPRSPERNRVNFRGHKAIVDAIVDRDPEAADDAVSRHLHAAWEYVRVTFESGTVSPKR